MIKLRPGTWAYRAYWISSFLDQEIPRETTFILLLKKFFHYGILTLVLIPILTILVVVPCTIGSLFFSYLMSHYEPDKMET
jgi:hypothetical protein